MGYSMRSGRLVLLVLVACTTFGCRVYGQSTDEQRQVADNETITLEGEQIFVKFEGESRSSFSLMMELQNDTVRNLYEDIKEYEGILGPCMKLRLGDSELSNLDAKLSDCNIQAGTTVTVVVSDDQFSYTADFFVKTLDGRELPVKTKLSQSVSSLKDSVTQLTGIPQAEQRLLFLGKELKNECKLGQYGIDDGAKVQLGRPVEDCNQTMVKILVKTLGGATIEVEPNLADTGAQLKERIADKAGVPACVQQIAFNNRMISDNDRLCDLGLETGSIAYMFLYSPRITSLEQVARLQDAPARRAPIFREAAAEDVQASDWPSIYRDARNWIARTGSRPGWDASRFNPIAYLEPNPDSEASMELDKKLAKRLPQPGAEESERLAGEILLARIKLSSAVRAYRVAANLTSDNRSRQQPGISLAGGSCDATGSKSIPLGADVNNWAPDAFSDSDLMRLFEVCERVARVQARAAQTGRGILSIASQDRINNQILMTYLEALAGYSRPVEYNQARGAGNCAVCQDDLLAEPAVLLACEHAFHADCLLSWAIKRYQAQRYPSCPYCRQRFMFAYEALGKAELGTGSELDGNYENHE